MKQLQKIYIFFLVKRRLFTQQAQSGHTIEKNKNKKIKNTYYLDCFVILQGIGTNCVMRVQPKIPQILTAAGCLFRPKTIEKLRHFSCITMYVCKKKFHFRHCNWKKGLQALIFLQILCSTKFWMYSLTFIWFPLPKVGKWVQKSFSSQCALWRLKLVSKQPKRA